MNKNMKNILEKIKNTHGVNTFQPFLNKYFWNPDINLLSCYLEKVELQNESILILEGDGEYTEKPYILEMDIKRLGLLMRYFSSYPIHLTNRIAVNTCVKACEKNNYNCKIEQFISKKIKPAIMITFSKPIGDYLKDNFKLYLQDNLKYSNCWKGMLEIGDKYFFVYCIPDIITICNAGDDNISETDGSIDAFFNSSSIYGKQTCLLLSKVHNAVKSFIFPEDFIDHLDVRDTIKRLNNIKSILRPRFLYLPKEFEQLCSIINDFDEYDILAAQILLFTHPRHGPEMSVEHYIKLRSDNSAENICKKYIEINFLNKRYYVLKLALVQLFLFIKYPEETFNAQWENVRIIGESFTDIYRDAVNRIK